MARKVGIICTICIIVSFVIMNMPQKPKLVSSITSMDTAYLTILVDRREAKDVEKLKEKLLQMCREDSFENMKLQTEDKQLPENLHISVYCSEKEIEKGIPYLTIKNDAED